MKAKIEISEKEPYAIIWKSKNNDFRDFSPILGNINYYNEKIGEDVELDVLRSNFIFHIDRDEKFHNVYRLSGTIELEINIIPSFLDYLAEVDFSVDYSLDFEDKNENIAELDEDYIFGSNYNVILEID